MPTSDAETAQYLWACLENCGPIKINFHAVAAGCGINANAASVRYYRLRDAVKKGKGPKIDGDKLNYLWLCLQNNLSTKIDFHAVGKAHGINSNAASVRYYRLKKRLEADATGNTKAPPKSNGSIKGTMKVQKLNVTRPVATKQTEKRKRGDRESDNSDTEAVAEVTMARRELRKKPAVSQEPSSDDEAANSSSSDWAERKQGKKRKVNAETPDSLRSDEEEEKANLNVGESVLKHVGGDTGVKEEAAPSMIDSNDVGDDYEEGNDITVGQEVFFDAAENQDEWIAQYMA